MEIRFVPLLEVLPRVNESKQTFPSEIKVTSLTYYTSYLTPLPSVFIGIVEEFCILTLITNLKLMTFQLV